MSGQLYVSQNPPAGPRPQRGAEFQLVLEHERRGVPFLVFRGAEGELQVMTLPIIASRVTVGRQEGCDLVFAWDLHLSRSHAELTSVGGHWTLVDEGLSRNGTFVNDDRISGRCRLDDGDVIRAGSTLILYRNPGVPAGSTTRIEPTTGTLELTPMQRKVLFALCRPLVDDPYAAPASNRQIADDLVLSTEAIKTHMRNLFDKFDVEGLPQNQKRARVAQLAFQRGLVNQGDRSQIR